MCATVNRGVGRVLLVGVPAETGPLLTRLLAEEGYDVREASDAAGAAAAWAEQRADLVVARAEVVEELPEVLGGVTGPHVPVLALVEGLTHGRIETLLAAGVADLLPLPLEAAQLSLKVREILRGSRRERAEVLPGDAADVLQLGDLGLEVLAAIPAWLLVVRADRRIRFVNRTFARSLGMSPADLIGSDLESVLLPGLSPVGDALDAVSEVLSTGRPATVPVLRHRSPGGEERYVNLQITPLRRRDEPYAILILHDISEHWIAQRTVEREKRKLEEIVNGMGAALAILDPDLRVRWSNRTFTDWFGRLWGGRRFDHVLRGQVMAGETEPEKIFTEPEHVSKEWAHYTAGGDKRYYRNIVLPSHDDAGLLKELVLVVQDLTDSTLRAEQHRLLQDLGSLLQSTLELDRLLYIILTCATAGHALGFNRGFLFLGDPAGGRLKGVMGVGPTSREEAFVIWADLAGSQKSLADLTADFERYREQEKPLTDLIEELSYPLHGPGADAEILVRTCRENRVQLVRDAFADPRVTTAFRDRFGAREFVSVPLQSKGRVVGVLLADNIFSSRPISDEQVAMLELFAAPAGLAVDNARTYDELRGSMEQLEEAQEALLHSERLATVGRLAAHVAHEIRNPLTTIGGFARSILKGSGDPERVEKSASIIAEEVTRLEEILSEVMDFTRPARPHLELAGIPELIRAFITKTAPEIEDAGVELVVEVREPIPPCRFDGPQLQQVLLNLVRNGLESLDPEVWEGERRLILRAFATDEEIRIEIEDSGAGVAPDLLERIFEPFVSQKTRGTGLGLAVVRKVLLDHGGDVTVRSESGRGATFCLSLPRLEGDGEETAAVLDRGSPPG